ncbi:MAG: LruC domain-containing protein [Prevotella sp.]|nr:LruC domain-containing protein [Prevotella sp.]
MNLKSVLLMGAAAVMLVGCQSKDLFDEEVVTGNTEDARQTIATSFDYKLTAEIPVMLNYNRAGALIEIYDADSTSVAVASSTKRPSKIYAAYTGANGQYQGKMVIPSSLIGKKVYAFSKSIGVKNKVEGTITRSGLVLNETGTRAEQLGKTGIPAGIREAIEGALPEAVNNEAVKAAAGESDINIKVKKDCTIEVTFVWGGAGNNYWTGFWGSPNDPDDVWKCQRGEPEPTWVCNDFKCNLYYFTYTAGHVPTAEEIEANFINDEHLVIAGADQATSNDLMGTTVRLTLNGSTTIPAGTRIGWVVTHPNYQLVNKWNPADSYAANYRMPFIYSIDALNPDQKSQSIRYAYGTGDDKVIVYGIEDLSTLGNDIWGETWPEHEQHIATQTHAENPYFNMPSDWDYNDVMFVVKADPIDAITDDEIPDMPEVEDQYSEESIEGTLLYEDLFPNQGDYDMNDVVITYKLTKFFNQQNKIVKLGYEFTPVWSGASYHSSFSFLFDDIITTPVNIFDDQLDYVPAYSAPETLRTFKGEVASGKLVSMDKDELKWDAFNPYITVKGTGYEVHLTKKAPSANAKLDGLDVYQRAYVNDSNFPFAMNIPTKNFEVVTERIRIDVEYPSFVNWVRSNGAEATDWYAAKAK